MKAYSNFSPNKTPQTEQARPDQIKNEAGGYVFQTSKWLLLRRFLFLGTEGGTYYVSEEGLTRQNANNALACIKEDGKRVVELVVELAESGRTFRQSPLLFVLALASYEGDDETKRAAYQALPRVARIPTHLIEFVHYRTNFGGWGRGLRRAVADWYLRYSSADEMAYHMLKYQSRYGWSNRDLIRLSHPVPSGSAVNSVIRWVLGKSSDDELPKILLGFNKIKDVGNPAQAAKIISEYRLPREAVPTHLLNYAEVWEALLDDMPMTAMIRNLNKMTEVGLLTSGSEVAAHVYRRLTNQEALRNAKVHPLALLNAQYVYSSGGGVRGSLHWTPVQKIVDALDQAFYLSYGNVQPTGKKIALAIDISGSMGASYVGGFLPCVNAAVAQALVTMSIEPDAVVYVFDTNIQEAPFSSRQRLDDAMRTLNVGGGTDCSLPFSVLLDNKIYRDALIIYTDNETWAGGWHPFEAMDKYRRKTNAEFRAVNVAMAAVRAAILPFSDPDCLEVIGLDSSTPEVISEFVKGEF